MNDAKSKTKKYLITQLLLIIVVVASFFTVTSIQEPPPDYLPEKLDREDRRGAMYGYVFLPWEQIMQSGVEEQYMDLVAQALDFCYVHIQWSVVGIDNNTLNENYLGNLTLWIKGLAERNVDVVIHIWVSSYSPSWMYEYTPELMGEKERWEGIEPNTTNNTERAHRDALKYSMIQFQEMLCQYFIDAGVQDNIIGWCLDDETQSDNWTDFFADITKTIHSYNPNWETMVMFNRWQAYSITQEANMDVHAMDPYDQDGRFIAKINYAYEVAGTEKISVLIDAMGGHEDSTFHNKMRRQAWIAWFMGADSIGWYTFLYGSDQWACALNRWNDGLGPEHTKKTETTLATAADIKNLNEAFQKIIEEKTDNPSDGNSKLWIEKLLAGYEHAKANRFTEAQILIQEVLQA